jgi:glycosyltransferase involved in cell wall biosynthesis
VVEQLRRAVPGGIGTFAAGLLMGLDQLGPDAAAVSLLASRPPRGAPDPLARFGRPVLTSRLGGRLLTRAWDLSLLSAPAGFDVVHAVSLAFPLPERPSATRLAVSVYDLAWRHHPETSTPRGRRWHEAAFARALRQADVLVVPSEQVAEDVRRAGARPDRVAVVVPGADHLARPDHQAAAARLRRAGVEGPYLLTVSTLEPRKNLTRLVAAYGRARDRLPGPWPLVVVGPQGWGGGPLRPSPGVALLGQVSPAELSGLYAGAALFAYVPLLEGYGLPPVEAMTFGVPTVVSRGVPSVAEAPAGVSRLVDPLDIGAVAEALVEVAGSEDRRLALAAAGSTLAAGRRWRTTAEQTVALWASR